MDVVSDTLCKPMTVLSVGDNYQLAGGLNSIMDREFNESFMFPYRYDSLQVPWFNALGNMDYTG